MNDECDSKEGASWGGHVVSISAARSATNREQDTNGDGLVVDGRISGRKVTCKSRAPLYARTDRRRPTEHSAESREALGGVRVGCTQ